MIVLIHIEYWSVNTQTQLRLYTASSEPSLLVHTKKGSGH